MLSVTLKSVVLMSQDPYLPFEGSPEANSSTHRNVQWFHAGTDLCLSVSPYFIFTVQLEHAEAASLENDVVTLKS